MIPPEFRMSGGSNSLGGSNHRNSSTLTAASSITTSATASSMSDDAHCLNLSVGLVGRDTERRVLEQAHDRVCCRVQQAPSEIVLVEGASGMGKSSLVVSALTESIEQAGMGLFVQGKYDFHSVAPYQGLVDAATELCHCLQQDAGYYLDDVREHLSAVLSNTDDCRLLLNLIPAAKSLLVDGHGEDDDDDDDACGCEGDGSSGALGGLIGEPQAAAGSGELSNPSHEFALKRFLQVFCKFWNAVASVHPVVLFLDDLQWDMGSKDFLTALVKDKTSTNLLVVGAFREGEFDWKPPSIPEHESASQQQQLRISQINLGPLSQTHVNEILARATRREPADTMELGEIIHRKTDGNALFIWQFLDMLHATGLLYFSFPTNQFEWDDAIAHRTDVSDNVAALLAQKMTRLSTRAQTVLMVAACLGHSFDRNVLETIVLSSKDLRQRSKSRRRLRGGRRSQSSRSAASDASGMSSVAGDATATASWDDDEYKTTDDEDENDKTSNKTSSETTAETAPTTTESKESSLMIDDSERQRLQSGLADAVKAGLIEAVSDTKLKFSHDAIQQAAFDMVPAGMDKDSVHAGLGERILQFSRTIGHNQHGKKNQDWMFLSAVDLLTRQESTVQASQFSRQELASLCLEAARTALNKSAFITAATYADRGYALLRRGDAGARRWESHYALCLDLCTLSATMHHSYGDHDGAIQATSDVVVHAERIEDKISAQRVLVASRLAQKDTNGGIRESVAILKDLGVKVPEKPNKFHVLALFIKVKRLLRGRGASDLHDLPNAKDTRMVEAMRVFLDLSLAAWLSNNEELTMVTCLMMMSLTLTYGVSSYSSCAFAVYGVTLSHFGNLDEAYQYGCLAMEVQEKMGTKLTKSRVHGVSHFFLEHLQKPILASLEPLQHAYNSGMQAGDVNFAGMCLVVRTILGMHGNMRLDHMETQVRGYCTFMREYQLDSCLNSIVPFFQLVLNLRGKSDDPRVLTGEAIESEADFMAHAHQGDIMPLVYYQNARVALLVVLDELELADGERKALPPDAPGTYFSKCINLFFCGLACLGLARKRKREGKGRSCRYYQNQARKYKNQLDKFVEHGSMNCVPFVRLLEAEALCIRPLPHERTIKAYQDAISAAARCGFRLCKGLACEKAGQYMLEQGKQCFANDYLQQAWSEFSDYGALAKLSQMELRYAGICSFEGDECCSQESSRPSSLTKPHYIQAVVAACK